jgi:formylglycine-generating enzyme required for sulfatase activity
MVAVTDSCCIGDSTMSANRVKKRKRSTKPAASTNQPPHRDMVWIPSGTFRMGSNDHYPEEAPVHHATVDGFWMDKYQVTNAQYARFVRETGYVTAAERAPNPADYPGAPPENLVPGSLVFLKTKGPVDLRYINQWWVWTPGAYWRRPEGPRSNIKKRKHHDDRHGHHPYHFRCFVRVEAA